MEKVTYRWQTQADNKAFNMEGSGYMSVVDAVRAAATALENQARRLDKGVPSQVAIVVKGAR